MGKYVLLLLLVLGLVFRSQSFGVQGETSLPTVRIYPQQTLGLSINDSFTVYVVVDNAVGVEAAQVQFTYDLTVLTALDVEEGPFMESVGSTIITQNYAAPISDTVGEVYYQSAGTSGATVSGSGVLLNVTFRVVSEGASSFHLLPYLAVGNILGTCFLDINSAEIVPSDLEDGYYDSPISLSVERSVIGIGDSAMLSGSIFGSAALNVSNVSIEYMKAGGNWSILGIVSTNGSGYFSYQWRGNETGIFAFQAFHTFEGRTVHSNPTVEIIILNHSVPAHDISVNNVGLSKTVIGRGFSGSVSVYVVNDGGSAETFNVTVYANSTAMGTQLVYNLNAIGQLSLTFTSNTTGFAYGNYAINAFAWPVPGETNTADNNMTRGWVIVTMPGDIDGNFRVQLQDLVLLAQVYGSRIGDAKWNPNADIDDNGTVGLSDLVALAQHYGQHYP